MKPGDIVRHPHYGECIMLPYHEFCNEIIKQDYALLHQPGKDNILLVDLDALTLIKEAEHECS